MKFPLYALVLLVATAVVQAAPVAEPATAPVVAEPLAEKEGLRISISAPRHAEDDQLYLDFFRGTSHPCIDVLLQNTSAHPIYLIGQWNSEGYSALTLKITAIDGKVLEQPLVVARDFIPVWRANAMYLDSIAPGESLTRQVFLSVPGQDDKALQGDSSLYRGFPLKSHKVTMSAVFYNRVPLVRNQKPAWMGEIASPPRDYTFSWDQY